MVLHNLIIRQLIFWIINFFAKFNKLIRICLFKIFFVSHLPCTFKNAISILWIWIWAVEFNFRRVFIRFKLRLSQCLKRRSHYWIVNCHGQLSWFTLSFLQLWISVFCLFAKSLVYSFKFFGLFWGPNYFSIFKFQLSDPIIYF